MNMKQPDCSLLCVQRYLQNTRLDEARQMGLFSHAQPKSSWQKGGATKRGHSGYRQTQYSCCGTRLRELSRNHQTAADMDVRQRGEFSAFGWGGRVAATCASFGASSTALLYTTLPIENIK